MSVVKIQEAAHRNLFASMLAELTSMSDLALAELLSHGELHIGPTRAERVKRMMKVIQKELNDADE